MKAKATYILLAMAFLLFPAYTLAQQESWNLDFETWNDSMGTTSIQDTIIKNRVGLFPPKWHYRSSHIPEGTGLGRTTDATSGEYAVTLSGFYQYLVMRIISGESDQKPGWPIDFRPTRLLGDYKVILIESACDSLRGYVSVFLSKYDSVNQVRDTIGEGHITLKETLDVYESFDIPINYKNATDQPDSVIIVLAKERFGFDSPPPCLECSHVYYDNLHLSTFPTSNKDQIEELETISISPNPAGDSFKITFKNHQEIHTIHIMNAKGQVIEVYTQVAGELIVDSSHLSPGFYFISFENTSTGKIQTQKFMVK